MSEYLHDYVSGYAVGDEQMTAGVAGGMGGDVLIDADNSDDFLDLRIVFLVADALEQRGVAILWEGGYEVNGNI